MTVVLYTTMCNNRFFYYYYNFFLLIQVCLCCGGVGLVSTAGAHLESAVEDGNLLLDQRSAL